MLVQAEFEIAARHKLEACIHQARQLNDQSQGSLDSVLERVGCAAERGLCRTSRSAKVSAKSGDQDTRGHISTARPLNSRGSGPPMCAPSMASALQLAWYVSSSPVVAEWLGLPAAALARASAGEFFTGLYAAHTCANGITCQRIENIFLQAAPSVGRSW